MKNFIAFGIKLIVDGNGMKKIEVEEPREWGKKNEFKEVEF